MSISIFTITHVPFTPPENPIYIPLQAGSALHDDYGYLRDNTGDNISAKNPYYSELTGLYWIWKNYTDADYLGLCHYRRYFLNEMGELMNEAEYMDILARYDVMISQSRLGAYDYRTVYARSHDIRNLDMTGEVIKELYPDYYETFQAVIADNHCYVGNLFAAPKALFCAYCEWLFTIFAALETKIDVSGYDDYHKRVFGFLSEQLLIVWIKHNNLSYYEAPFGLSQEKAETITLKQDIQNYLHKGEIDNAYAHLCDTLEKRPDLLLEMSDFHQELKTIEHILNVCRVEEEAGLPTLLQFSQELDILIKHFRLLVTILTHIRQNSATQEEVSYLLDCKASYKAIVYILQNFEPLSRFPQTMLNALSLLYTDAGNYLTALSFLEEALTIRETNGNTLSNIVTVLERMGQNELAEEYRQAHDAVPKRIAVFTGGKIFILRYLAEQYALSMESLGHTVFRFDKSNMDKSYEELTLFHENGLDCAIVLNNIGFQMFLESGRSLWDIWNIPCYNIIVDHPVYYFDTLDNAPHNGIVACADRYHTDYIKRFYPTVQRTIFLPTAGECLKPFADLKPFAERSIDVLFIGGFKYDTGLPRYEFSTRLMDELMLHPDRTYEETVENCLAADNLSLSGEELKEVIQIHRFYEKNTTALFRVLILKTLLDAGISVTVYGSAFESCGLYGHPNFIYKGECSMEEGIRLMEDSKIVLNQLAWFKAGSSERIYEAMLQGAVSLTDDSIYLRETFEDNVDIKFYTLDNINALPDIVRSILSEPDKTEILRGKAYQKAYEQHTWLQRAITLLDDLADS